MSQIRRRPVKPGAVPRRKVIKKKPAPAGAKQKAEESKKQEEAPVASTPQSEKPTSNKPPVQKPPKAKKEKKSSGGGKGMGILFLILFLGAAGFAIYEYMQLDSVKSDLEAKTKQLSEIDQIHKAELEAKEQELQQLVKDYRRIGKEREELGLSNKELNNQIADLQASLKRVTSAKNSLLYQNNELKNQLASAGTSPSDEPSADAPKIENRARLTNEMDDLINKYQQELKAKDEEIIKLKRINGKLSQHVDKLVARHGEMSKNITSLEEKLKLASVLYVDNFEVANLTTKNDLEYDEFNEFKQRKINRLRFAGKIEDNKVADKGDKTFYLKLVDPNGNVMFDIGKPGGSFKTMDGKTDFYTLEKSLNFENASDEIFFIFTQSKEYEEGVYKAELFSEGFKVAEESFVVK